MNPIRRHGMYSSSSDRSPEGGPPELRQFDLDEGADPVRGRGEHHHGVALGTSEHLVGVLLGRSFDQHGHPPAEALPPLLPSDLSLKINHRLKASRFVTVGDGVLETKGPGTFPRIIAVHEGVVKSDLSHELEGGEEVRLGFPRETYEQVRGQSDVGNRVA